jgi:very-short-patch-repair endonuclease
LPQRREKNETVLRARALRRSMTLPEGMLWQVLRKRPEGYKFRNQHPIGRCVVDFYCAATRLVIEVDGEATLWAIDRSVISGATSGFGLRASE